MWGELREEGMELEEPRPLVGTVGGAVEGLLRSRVEEEVEGAGEWSRFSSERVWRRVWVSLGCTGLASRWCTSTTST